MKVKSEREGAQSCPTLSDPMDCSLPGSSIHGIFQARVLEWVATAFSKLFIILPYYAFSSSNIGSNVLFVISDISNLYAFVFLMILAKGLLILIIIF